MKRRRFRAWLEHFFEPWFEGSAGQQQGDFSMFFTKRSDLALRVVLVLWHQAVVLLSGIILLIGAPLELQGKPSEQNSSSRGRCASPITMVILPVDIRESENPITQRKRYEIRSCKGERAHLQLLGFEHGSGMPALVLNTDANWIVLMISKGVVLGVQVLDGVGSNTFYLLTFRNGKPVEVAEVSTPGGITYSEEGLEHPIRDLVKFTVPFKTYPGEPDRPARRYQLDENDD